MVGQGWQRYSISTTQMNLRWSWLYLKSSIGSYLVQLQKRLLTSFSVSTTRMILMIIMIMIMWVLLFYISALGLLHNLNINLFWVLFIWLTLTLFFLAVEVSLLVPHGLVSPWPRLFSALPIYPSRCLWLLGSVHAWSTFKTSSGMQNHVLLILGSFFLGYSIMFMSFFFLVITFISFL